MSDDDDAPPPVAGPPSPVGSDPLVPSPSASSAPPDPQGEQIPASRLHPLWEASRGGAGKGKGAGGGGRAGGRGRGGGKPASDAGDGDRPRFERISLAALEQTHLHDADGADSALNSEDEEERAHPPHASRKRKPAAEAGPRRERAGDSEEEEEESDDDDRRDKLQGLMGAAVFGGGGQRPVYGQSLDGSEVSETSTNMRRKAQKDAYPVRGVSCVGCALSNRIGPVDAFIKNNVSRMTDNALFKMAALAYRREVAEPAEREGAVVPAWGWKDVELHYKLHATGNTIARNMMIRSLQNMRAQAEERLVRCDNGEKELDRQGADLLLKVCFCTHSTPVHTPITDVAL
tara:strand:- start:1036 stop:2073 length:1038 start_codon:yes stop_codon:yes gene_type:complete